VVTTRVSDERQRGDAGQGDQDAGEMLPH
jgi:hypothetical protein